MIRDIDDSDKHRLLHVAMAQPWNAHFQNVDASVLLPGETVELWLSTTEVVDGAEIAAIIYPRPSPDMEHKLLTAVVVSVAHRLSPATGRERSELADVLTESLVEVKSAITRIVAKT